MTCANVKLAMLLHGFRAIPCNGPCRACCVHPILWIRNPKTLTRPLGFLIFTTAFKKFAWSPRALGQFLIPLPRPQAILGCSLSISSDFALLLKRCVSTRGFGCTDRELLAPQICRDMTVFVSRNKKSTESRPLISYLMDFLNMRSGVVRMQWGVSGNWAPLAWE